MESIELDGIADAMQAYGNYVDASTWFLRTSPGLNFMKKNEW